MGVTLLVFLFAREVRSASVSAMSRLSPQSLMSEGCESESRLENLFTSRSTVQN